jgi:hypothetical protein
VAEENTYHLHPEMYPLAAELFSVWSDDVSNVFWLAKALADKDPDRDLNNQRAHNLVDESFVLYSLIKHLRKQLQRKIANN